VIFWNRYSAWTIDLTNTKDTVDITTHKLDFLVDPKEHQTYIRTIKVGSDEKTICIEVRQSVQDNCLIVWDMK